MEGQEALHKVGSRYAVDLLAKQLAELKGKGERLTSEAKMTEIQLSRLRFDETVVNGEIVAVTHAIATLNGDPLPPMPPTQVPGQMELVAG